jgi:hypothetical protein
MRYFFVVVAVVFNTADHVTSRESRKAKLFHNISSYCNRVESGFYKPSRHVLHVLTAGLRKTEIIVIITRPSFLLGRNQIDSFV